VTQAACRLQQVISRYRRDIALLRGEMDTIDLRDDDIAVLIWAPQDDIRGFINDRRLRVKLLEATVDLLQEPPGAAGLGRPLPCWLQTPCGARPRHLRRRRG
jgi:hypothetical protein